jgi:hypothetical protein
MTQNRREFFKVVGVGAATSLAVPGISIAQSTRVDKQLIKNNRNVFTTVALSADVVVAGGGLAGVCAAIAAARNGAQVVLVQDRSRLGGNASSEIRMHALGARQKGWRETGIIEELKLTESATNLQRSFEMWDLILYDKVISEKNITLLLDTSVIDAKVAGDKIKSCEAISPLLEEYYEIQADYFLDCTGDSTLAAVAGADFLWGREGKDVFGESLAPDKSDNKTMGNTILFFAKKHDSPMPFLPPEWANVYTKSDFVHRKIGSYEYGYWWLEIGGMRDTIKDNRAIRQELLAIVMGIWDYIKNSGQHTNSENWALDWIGMIPGKRENRRIVGEHIMVQDELINYENYPDRCAYGGWPIDDHAPEGFYKTDQAPTSFIDFDKPYSIPLRSLYSNKIQNLLMAGRNLSASHVALASTRVMSTCAVIGQAAGTAAAFCVKKKCLPRELSTGSKRLKEYQQILVKDDQSLLSIKNNDPLDIARNAKIKASSFTQNGKPELVINGWNRDVTDGDVHQWRAVMNDGSQWIELSWPTKQNISKIQITFDSGSHRRLALSGNDGYYNPQIRGPQPETVADYVIEAKVNGKFEQLVNEKENYLRLVRHSINTIKSDKIRINIKRTHGDELARIFEIRCYA